MQPIRLGATGREVADVQRRLADLGLYDGGDDPGVFGPRTDAAVRAFQQQRGLVADGTVGPETWRALVEAGFRLGDRHLYLTRPMLRGDDVRELQARLNRLGFDTGAVDGIFGPDTDRAVRDFQLNVGLTADGIVGPDTVRLLRVLDRPHQEATAFAVRERERLRRRRPSLAGARVFLDPGHGPADPGWTAPNGRTEQEVAWELVRRIAGRLIAHGAQVLLSRGPTTTPDPSRRAALANRLGADVVVSVHLNGLDSVHARGAAGYYFGTDGVTSEAGQLLADLLVDAVVDATGTPHCRTHPSTSAILRETRAPAALIEPGFLTHPEEGLALQDPAYQDTIADAVLSALITYLIG